MPFSTTWFSVCKLGSPGAEGSGPSACADAKAGESLWRCLHRHGKIGDYAGIAIQRRYLSGFLGTTSPDAPEKEEDGHHP